ncbi:MAG: hypothetical protein RBT75_15745, partial [Anaerolineae bacterium]|nr:hypothetical protein [Anaerolineae bacterium]
MMNKKIAFRLSVVLALVAVGLLSVLSMDLPTQATFIQQPAAQTATHDPVQDPPDDFFAPSPAADAQAPAEPATTATMLPLTSATTPWALPDPVWRVGITQDGLYHLSYETLAAAGVPVTEALMTNFQLWHRGIEVAIEI